MNSSALLKLSAKKIVDSYLSAFPSEIQRLRSLVEQLAVEDDDIFKRSNMHGHITASALVLDQSLFNVLMIFHPVYNKWMVPGGHVEPGCTSIWEAACEEVTQETGLPIDTSPKNSNFTGELLDIDAHPIPANSKKGEGEHQHYDFCHVAVTTMDCIPKPQIGDSVQEAKWISLMEFAALPGDRNKRLLSKGVEFIETIKADQRKKRPTP